VFFDGGARIAGERAFHPRGEQFRVDTLLRRLGSEPFSLSQQRFNRSIAVG
jgi:hypothetical protein